MPGSPTTNDSSFIPKRGPARRRQPKSRKQIFLFTVIAYSLLFASLIAAGATYVYKNYLTAELQKEVAALDSSITTFSTADLAAVREFDVTLKRATERVDNNASVVALLDGVDKIVVEPVQLESLTVTRNADQGYSVNGMVVTSSFDAALFQRKMLNLNKRLFTAVSVDEVQIAGDVAAQQAQSGVIEQEVRFKIDLEVPLEEVLYQPTGESQTTARAAAAPAASVETSPVSEAPETPGTDINQTDS